MIKWKLETRKLKDLKPHPKNPRQLTKDQERHLSISIDKFGLIDKPIINQDGSIIGGHQRLNVLKKNKIKEVECYVPDRPLDEKEIDELNIRLNKNSGSFDWDVLANEFEVTDLIEWGFNGEELHLGLSEEEPQKEKQETWKCPTCGKQMKKAKDE